MRAPAGPSGAFAAPVKKKPYVGPTVAPPNKAPLIGAVNRRLDSGMGGVGGGGSSHGYSTPKPAPVVVSNNQGQYTKPKPPPPVQPGPIAPVANKHQAPSQINKAPVTNKAPGPSATPPVPSATPSQPAPPGIDQYLAGDTQYQGALTGYNKTLSDYLASAEAQRGTGAGSFAERLRQLQQSQTEDTTGLQDEYAGRGLAQSSVYADALANLQNQYQTSQSNLNQEQTQFNTGLDSGITNQQALIQQYIQQAQDQALQRRLAQYNL